MSAITIGANLDESRVRIFADRFNDLAQCVADFAKVHPVHDFTRNVVALRAIDDLLERSRAFHRSTHGEEIVLANKNDRQSKEGGEIERFVKGALIDRAVAEKTKRDAIFLAVLGREGDSCRERHVRANDGMPAIHVIFAIEKMHGTTKAP